MTPQRSAILPILLGILAGSPLACADDEPQHPGATPPPPATTGAASTGPGSEATTAVELPTACDCLFEPDAQDCPCQACAADHALGDPPPEPEAFTCRATCIPADEPLLWCFYDPDAADPSLGCCTGVCRPDGLCGDPIAETSGPTDDTSTDTGSSTDIDTGTSTGTGTDTGASSSTDATDTGTSAGSSTDTGTTAGSSTSTG